MPKFNTKIEDENRFCCGKSNEQPKTELEMILNTPSHPRHNECVEEYYKLTPFRELNWLAAVLSASDNL
jgi:hypothetical protein